MKTYDELKAFIEQRQKYEQNNPGITKTTINFATINGYTLLAFAAQEGKLKEVEQLLSEGAKINPQDRHIVGPLAAALKGGHLDVVQKLYEAGAICDELLFEEISNPECRKWFATRVYFERNDRKTIQLFKEQLSQPDESNKLDSIQRAAEVGLSSIARTSLDKLKSYTNYPILSLTVENEQFQLADELIEAGIDINWSNCAGQTALMLAVISKNEKAIKYLLAKSNHDLLAKNIVGFNLFHTAANANDPKLFKLLLDKFSAQHINITDLLTEKNIYGLSALDIVLDKNNLDILQVLSPYIPEQFKEKAMGIPFSHKGIVNNLLYYYCLAYFDSSLVSEGGVCNGLTYLWLYYRAQGKEDYFFDTCRLIASWDGEEASLIKPFDEGIPQAEYYKKLKYKNLKDLITQWSNDILWYQHTANGFVLSSGSHDSQTARSAQHEIVMDNPDYLPELLHQYQQKFSITQLGEMLQIFIRMPAGINVEISCNHHLTAFQVEKKQVIHYFDSNYLYKCDPFTDINSLLQQIQIRHTYYGLYKKNESIFFELDSFYFAKDKKNLQEFEFFKPDEYPQSFEKAFLYQKKSANGFSYLDVALLSGSEPSFSKLLEDGFCYPHDKLKFKVSSDLTTVIINHEKMPGELNLEIAKLSPQVQLIILGKLLKSGSQDLFEKFESALANYNLVIDKANKTTSPEEVFKNAIKHKLQELNKSGLRHFNQALNARNREQFEEAIKLFEQQVQLYSIFNQQDELAISFSNLASCYRELKDYEKASFYCEQTLSLFKLDEVKNKELIIKSEVKLQKIKDLSSIVKTTDQVQFFSKEKVATEPTYSNQDVKNASISRK